MLAEPQRFTITKIEKQRPSREFQTLIAVSSGGSSDCYRSNNENWQVSVCAVAIECKHLSSKITCDHWMIASAWTVILLMFVSIP